MRKIQLLCILTLLTCTITAQTESSHDLIDRDITEVPTEIDAELRGVWVSTVQRVDFPSRATTDSTFLKEEWLQLLEFYKTLNLNAVVVQVRPTGDAIYPSKLAPMSKWLTGKSGRPLKGNFDLLRFMIRTAHAEGFEFHAWINPYRLVMDEDTVGLAPNHPFKTMRDVVFRYGKEWLFNPGEPRVWQHLTAVVRELAQKYPIDALHFDDYFYPYRNAEEGLRDSTTYLKYGRKFKKIGDWRRANTDSLIYNVWKAVKTHNPKIQIGVSPFAVWRNKADDTEGSATKAYQRCYDDLYADVLLWLRRGWLDYVAPEVYFHIGFPVADYAVLVDWWRKHSYGKRLYISHAIYKVNQQPKYPAWQDPEEIPRQISLSRQLEEVDGLLFFSSKWLIKNELGVTDALRERFFSKPAPRPKF